MAFMDWPGILGRLPFSQVVVVFNVGGWLTYGDPAFDVKVDFFAVVEHRLIPARVRSEWARLKKRGLASIWAPACQGSSHVGNAGVGVISMRGLLCLHLPLPSLRGSLITVERLGACFLLVLVSSCTGLFCISGLVRLRSRCSALPFGPPLGCLLLTRVGGSKSVEVQRVWDVYDERVQFMSRQDALQLDESLDAGDVSRAWLVWSGAAEAALADA